MARASMLEPCQFPGCDELAYEHHFSGHQDFKGDAARGKCSRNTPMADVEGERRCHCTAFVAKVKEKA